MYKTTPEKVKEIKEWFLQRYCDPVDCCPHGSGEAGYEWIWGGPYDARDVLDSEYPHDIEDGVFKKVIQELTNSCVFWSLKPDYDFDDIDPPDIEYKANFAASLLTTEELLRIKVPANLEQPYLRLLYSKVYSALEAYLCDCLKYYSTSTDEAVADFLAKCSLLKNTELSYKDLCGVFADRKNIIVRTLQGVIWHRFNKIEKYYFEVFGITFPEQGMKYLKKNITIRHDIVHRDGIDKEGQPRKLTIQELEVCISEIRNFVNEIENRVRDVVLLAEFEPITDDELVF